MEEYSGRNSVCADTLITASESTDQPEIMSYRIVHAPWLVLGGIRDTRGVDWQSIPSVVRRSDGLEDLGRVGRCRRCLFLPRHEVVLRLICGLLLFRQHVRLRLSGGIRRGQIQGIDLIRMLLWDLLRYLRFLMETILTILTFAGLVYDGYPEAGELKYLPVAACLLCWTTAMLWRICHKRGEEEALTWTGPLREQKLDFQNHKRLHKRSHTLRRVNRKP